MFYDIKDIRVKMTLNVPNDHNRLVQNQFGGLRPLQAGAMKYYFLKYAFVKSCVKNT